MAKEGVFASKKQAASKYVRKLCSHGRRKNTCVKHPCRGVSRCECKILKASCRIHAPENFCKCCDVRKQICKNGGVSICKPHGLQIHQCKKCEGNGICEEHGLRRAMCIACERSIICDCGLIKIKCNKCRGTSFCRHYRIKYGCKECGGSAICKPHGHIRSKCYECDGASTCKDHGEPRQKAKCKDCMGSALCVHLIERYYCKVCCGKGICVHRKRRDFCNDPNCGGGLALCCVPECDKVFSKKYLGHCMTCYIKVFPNGKVARNYKVKEYAVLFYIKEVFPDLRIVHDKRVDRISGGSSNKRPDFLIDMGSHVVIVEVDEQSHCGYDQSCEEFRMNEIWEDVGKRPVVFIRFNPDKNNDGPSCWGVDGEGLAVVKKKWAVEWQARLSTLKTSMEFWLTTIPTQDIEIKKLFY